MMYHNGKEAMMYNIGCDILKLTTPFSQSFRRLRGTNDIKRGISQ